MDPSPTSNRTSVSLLMRLAQSPRDESAWSAFVAVYGEQMQRWCRHWGLQDADARDLTQRVLLDLVKQLPEFTYDPSKRFRSWLKTVAHRAWQRYLETLQRPGRGTGDSEVGEMLTTVEARDDLAKRLEREYDLELLEMAMQEVRHQVQPNTWDAFRLLALEGHSGETVATQLGMSVDAVLKARSNFTKRLREQMQLLDGVGAE